MASLRVRMIALGVEVGQQLDCWRGVAGHRHDRGERVVRDELIQDGSRWFAVQCQPHRERGAQEHLLRQGYQVFLPLQRKTRRHARRVETVLRPFFPSYLFLRLDLSCDPWRPVNGTFGVARLVMRGDRPAPAPLGVIEALQMRCDADGAYSWRPDLVPGQSVRVTEGPFIEFVGELDRLDGPGRVRVLLNIMGTQVPATLARESVVPAGSMV